ncbi:glutathione S-transferase [Xylariaceae sp. FL0594]|nr:glutathione S-transferase [Xylariaceae sp. FL0594]
MYLSRLNSTSFLFLRRSTTTTTTGVRSLASSATILLRRYNAPLPVITSSRITAAGASASGSCYRYSSTSTTSKRLQHQQQQTEDEMSEEPNGLIAKSGIELLTFGTPNGYKISILLEELKEAYGKEYTWQSVNIMKGTQKEAWFTAVGANGRIPAIVDHNRGGFAVFEGLAILGYLTRRYDPENRFSFPVDSAEYDEAETWMAWQHGGLGPMQGQANHFLRFAKEKIPYGIQRYVGETERLYGVLDKRLEGRTYVVGEKFSIADINLLGWANGAVLAGIDLDGQFPNVQRWLERCLARPAVQRGFAIPTESSFSNAKLKAAAESDPEKKRQAEETAALIKSAKEQYGYKYASP